MNIQRTTMAMTCAFAMGLALPICEAQDAELRIYGDSQYGFVREVIVEGRGELSRELIGVVYRTVNRRLAKAAKQQDGDLELLGVELSNSYRLVDMDIGKLTITCLDKGQEESRQERMGKLWAAARQELELALRKVQQTSRNRQQAARERALGRIVEQRESYERERASVIDRLEAIGRRAAPEQMLQQLSQAENQLNELELNRVGLEARRGAIDERIDYLREAAAKVADDDPIVGELEKIVGIREQQLERVQSLYDVGGTVTEGEVREVEAKVAEARIELLKSKRRGADCQNGGVLAQLNDELSTLFVEDAEQRARQKALEQVVAELRDQTDVSERSQVESLEQKLKQLNELVNQTENELVAAQLDAGAPMEEISIRPLEDVLLPEGEPQESDPH
jgi:hypothetical protein